MRCAVCLLTLSLVSCQRNAVDSSPGPKPSVAPAVPITSAALSPANAEPEPEPSKSPAPPSDLAGAAEQVRQALLKRDMARLAKLVHPERGVRFSPYAYIDPEADIVLKAAELAPAFASKAKRRWGSYDGSGEPIELSFAKYVDAFVMIEDLKASEPHLNEIVGTGNSLNNLREVYPGSPFVEYHFPGNDDGMMWGSLRLVFQREGSKLYLIAIVHDQWTI